jgi:plastocyanin
MKRPLLLAASTATLAAGATGAFLPALASAAPATASISIAVKSDTQHAKKGSDGKWHDAFLPARFAVRTGQKVTVTIRNYDGAAHTFTSPRLALNVRIRPGTLAHPSLTTFTFKAPRAGSYTWQCTGACDPWAMTHLGYMMGRITVLA